MTRIDLHTHSNKSDGSLTPSQLIAYAQEKGLAAIALTDHDTIAGLTEAREKAREMGIEFIPGVELSAAYQGRDIHLVGLFVDEDDKGLKQALADFAEKRKQRNLLMIKKMERAGLIIDSEALARQANDFSLTRLHFALHLKEKGQVKELDEAFRKYLGEEQSCYVKKELLAAKEAIEVIFKSNGIPILAHPLRYGMTLNEVEEMVIDLKLLGLRGIECYYSLHSREEEAYLIQLAEKYGLLKSGGTDFHGKHKHNIDLGTGKGDLQIPEECLAVLRDVHEGKSIADVITIENAGEADAAVIARIEAACFPPAEAAEEETIRQRLQTFPECFFVAKLNGQIIGFINGCATDEAHLTDEMYHDNNGHKVNGRYQMIFGLDVLPEFRSQGVAGKLMKHMILSAKKRGRRGLVLTCKEGLIPYYESFGYKNKGKSQSAHGGADWFEMILAIIE